MPYRFSAVGFSSTRTLGSAPPPTTTWPTPLICDSFWARMVEAESNIWPFAKDLGRQRDHEDGRIGGIHLAVVRIVRQVGGQIAAGCVDGGLHVARGGIDVAVEIELQDDVGGAQRADEVISVTPAMRPNWRSSGVATEEAIVSGLAPGQTGGDGNRGKFTCGSGDTGSNRKAAEPASAMAQTEWWPPAAR